MEHLSDIRFYCNQGRQMKTLMQKVLLKIPVRALVNRAGGVPSSTDLDMNRNRNQLCNSATFAEMPLLPL